MPNPKVELLLQIRTAKNAKAGQVRFRTDKNGIVHGGIGKIGFDGAAVKLNLEALLADSKRQSLPQLKASTLKK